MTNNDIFKKLRVALQLRDDQIVEILELVDFRISKGEIGNFFRSEDHPKYMSCGDQILRNFLNGLIIHLRGTKDNPKDTKKILAENKAKVYKNIDYKKDSTVKNLEIKPTLLKKKITQKPKKNQVIEKFAFKNGKKK